MDRIKSQLRAVAPAPLWNVARMVKRRGIALKYTLTCKAMPPESFRTAKAKAMSTFDDEMRDAFRWILQDQAGGGLAYQEWQGEESVRRWLSWYRPHHFIWRRPSDENIRLLESGILELGRQTWRCLFRRPWLHHLQGHDTYSLPDIYYCVRALGRVPEVAVDIGGGWGRLGMAWTAAGCRSVAVVDSIEQPYILQNAYLRSVPSVEFQELLEKDDAVIDLSSFHGVSHLPLWKLPLVKSQTIDVVSVIQVLREVNRSMIFFLVAELKRVLRPGGLFYIRDNDPTYTVACMHDVKVHEYLLEQGFEFALRPTLVQGQDIHGIPRAFRWKG